MVRQLIISWLRLTGGDRPLKNYLGTFSTNFLGLFTHRIRMYGILMVTFTINIPQMLAFFPYMDPMGSRICTKKPHCTRLHDLLCVVCARCIAHEEATQIILYVWCSLQCITLHYIISHDHMLEILYNTELFFIYAKHTNIRCFKQLNKSKNKAFDLEEKS